jgi:hypothetical protein
MSKNPKPLPPARVPVHYELFADLARQNSHLRKLNYVMLGGWALLVLALILLSLRPLTAVRVHTDGSPELLSSLSPVNAPGPEEAEFVAKLASNQLLELTSGSVQRDLGKATSLMTAEFQRVYLDKVSKDPALTAIEKGNVRSVLDFDAKKTNIRVERDPKDNKPLRYFVELSGRLRVYRADVLTAPLATRFLAIRVTLLVVPRGPKTLSGLLVSWFDKESVEPPKGDPTVDANPLSPAPGPTLAAPPAPETALP